MEQFLSSAWQQLGIGGLSLVILAIYIWKNGDGKLIDVIVQQNNNETKMTDAVTELQQQTKLLGSAVLSLQQQLIVGNKEQTETILNALQEQQSAITAPFESLKASVDEVVALKVSVNEMIDIGQRLKTLLATNIPTELNEELSEPQEAV